MGRGTVPFNDVVFSLPATIRPRIFTSDAGESERAICCRTLISLIWWIDFSIGEMGSWKETKIINTAVNTIRKWVVRKCRAKSARALLGNLLSGDVGLIDFIDPHF